MRKYGAPGDGKIRSVLDVTKAPAYGQTTSSATPSEVKPSAKDEKERLKEKE